MTVAKRGDWVQIEREILAVGERAPQAPADTQNTPLMMWVKGFLEQDSCEIGQQGTIKTMTGRTVSGKLTALLPTYNHTFGEPQPELLGIANELRTLLQEVGQNE